MLKHKALSITSPREEPLTVLIIPKPVYKYTLTINNITLNPFIKSITEEATELNVTGFKSSNGTKTKDKVLYLVKTKDKQPPVVPALKIDSQIIGTVNDLILRPVSNAAVNDAGGDDLMKAPVTFLNSVEVPSKFNELTLEQAFTIIQNPPLKLKDAVLAAREAYSINGKTSTYTSLKKELPAFALNGTFTDKVVNDCFNKSSNLFNVDIDGLNPEDLEAVKTELAVNIPSLVYCFVSPSGAGVKAGIRLPVGLVNNDTDFKALYQIVEPYFKSVGYSLDGACKDVRRLCYVSYDPDIFINYQAEEFNYGHYYEQFKDLLVKPTQPINPEAIVVSTSINLGLENTAIGILEGKMRKDANDVNRHNGRLTTGRLLGGYVAGGWAREDVLFEALIKVSDEVSNEGVTSDEQRKTILDGIKYGKEAPISEAAFKKENGIHDLVFVGGAHTKPQNGTLLDTDDVADLAYMSIGNTNVSAAQWVERCNSNYAVVVNDNDQMRVVQLKYNEDKAQHELQFFTFDTFKQKHCSDFISIPPKSGDTLPKEINAGSFWLTNKTRTPNAKLIFNPDKPKIMESIGVVNQWTGLNISNSSEGGDPMPMVNHIINVLASGNKEHAGYILKWTALLVQRPGLHHGISLVLRGEKGTGKGVYGNLLIKIFGQHGKRLSQPNHLTGNFSGHLKNCCFVFADEAFFAGDASAEGRLKEIITEPTYLQESKGVDADSAVNHISVLMATNNEYVVPATKDERRYAMFDVSPQKRSDVGYWELLVNWEEKPENVTAFVEYLKAIDLSKFKPRSFIETKALKDQRVLSLEPWARWWKECLDQGYIGGNRIWPEYASNNFLTTSFSAYAASHNFNKYETLDPSALMVKLTKNKLTGPSINKRVNTGVVIATSGKWGDLSDAVIAPLELKNNKGQKDNRVKCRQLPTLDEARLVFINEFKLPEDIFNTGDYNEEDI